MNTQSLLGLLYLSSPALPIGAFAYSQGLESAIENDWVTHEGELTEWVQGLLTEGLAKQDLPLFFRLYSAWNNARVDKVAYWNNHVFACRESAELVLEEIQLGKSVLRLLRSLGKIPTMAGIDEFTPDMGFLAAFALI